MYSANEDSIPYHLCQPEQSFLPDVVPAYYSLRGAAQKAYYVMRELLFSLVQQMGMKTFGVSVQVKLLYIQLNQPLKHLYYRPE